MIDQYLKDLIIKNNLFIPNDLIEGSYRWCVYIYNNLFNKINIILDKDIETLDNLSIKIKSHHLINWVRDKLYEIHPDALGAYLKELNDTKINTFVLYKIKKYLLKKALKEQEYIIDNYIIDNYPNLKKYIKEEYMPEGKYEFDISTRFKFWGKDHWTNFNKIKSIYEGKNNLTFMEIGVCEGWTTTKLLDDILTGNNCYIYCIDPDPTPLFYKNMEKHVNKYLLVKEESINILPKLLNLKTLFDLIYIDGDHNAKAVLEDMVLSWRLLKIGGIMLVDDYELKITDPWFYKCHKEFKSIPRLMFIHPMVSIAAFMTIYKGCYEIIIENYQIALKKIVELSEM